MKLEAHPKPIFEIQPQKLSTLNLLHTLSLVYDDASLSQDFALVILFLFLFNIPLVQHSFFV